MSEPEDISERLAGLVSVEREYRVTIVALAVVVEQLLRATGGTSVEISDVNLANAPDLRAWRNVDRRSVEIAVSREGIPEAR